MSTDKVEALAPRMAAAGLTCHVIGDRHILFEEIMTLGLAAILHRRECVAVLFCDFVGYVCPDHTHTTVWFRAKDGHQELNKCICTSHFFVRFCILGVLAALVHQHVYASMIVASLLCPSLLRRPLSTSDGFSCVVVCISGRLDGTGVPWSRIYWTAAPQQLHSKDMVYGLQPGFDFASLNQAFQVM